MSHKENYNQTLYASFIGYIIQAIVNNFAPLLFLTFRSAYGIPLAQITLLVTINFGLQLTVDLFAALFLNKIGYRACVLGAHCFAAAGLILMAFLPDLLPHAFTGLLISVVIYALGGGLLEVVVSPIVEACPTKNKEKAMSMLHSFYCWGQVGVVLFSTVFFSVFGIEKWKILCILWALVPICNFFLFARAPIATLEEKNGNCMSMKTLFSTKIFWVLMLLMLCAGACELTISQWASTFAEKGLGISKSAGDLAGPMFFALLMGLSRLLYGKQGHKLDLQKFMVFSGILCAASFLLISLSPIPVLSLLGCGICGFSVGILWPGTYSIAAKILRGGGATMFAFLALAGDLGCTVGPTFAGFLSGAFGDNLRIGILASVVFPILLLVGLFACRRMQKKV